MRKLFRATFTKHTVEILVLTLLVLLLILSDLAVFAHPEPQPTPEAVLETETERKTERSNGPAVGAKHAVSESAPRPDARRRSARTDSASALAS